MNSTTIALFCLVTTALPLTSGCAADAGTDEGTRSSDAAVTTRLAWKSGFSACTNSPAVDDEIDSVTTWRGRYITHHVAWNKHDTWAEMENPDGSAGGHGKFAAIGALPSRLSIGMAMLPQESKGEFAQCAAGHFDAHYRSFAQGLIHSGNPDAVIRVGWEANGDWYPWAIEKDGVDRTRDYRACFRHIVDILRHESRSFEIDWTMAHGGSMSRSTTTAYPGDAYVDIIGVDYYDTWRPATDEAEWQTRVHETQHGGPRGLYTWLDFAKSRGKKLSVPEWGVMDAEHGGAGDNAFYVGKMYAFFKANAGHLAYESYFNCGNTYGNKLLPATTNPHASSKYQELWRKGL